MRLAWWLIIVSVGHGLPRDAAACAPADCDAAKAALALVAKLDTVAGSPASFETEPPIVALVAAGASAVEPLIDAMERDSRMTHAHFDPESELETPTLVPVYLAAYDTLELIIGSSFFTSERYRSLTRDRHAVAAALRAHWRATKTLTIVNRWFAALADDSATPRNWVFSVDKITDPIAPHVAPERDLPFDDGLRGERLRAHRSPSVTELIVRRIGARGVTVEQACELAARLARWDTPRARPVMAAQMARAIAAAGTSHDLYPWISDLARLRADAGDAVAIDEYAGWVAQTRRPETSHVDELEPLWLHPERPAAQRAIATLFGPQSPWQPLVDVASFTNSAIGPHLSEPLLGFAGFRAHLLAGLADAREVAVATTLPDHRYQLAHAGWTIGADAAAGDPDFRVPRTEAIRVGDFYAHELGKQAGAPAKLEYYWPLDKRTAAIAALRTWLAQRR